MTLPQNRWHHPYLDTDRIHDQMLTNTLYLAVLPIIHMGKTDFGRTEEFITVLPERKLATEFFPDEVEGYVATFRNRLTYLTGGHVKKWEIHAEPTESGRVIVRVVQYVA